MSKTVALTENQNWYRLAVERLESVKRDHPGHAEITRLEAVVADVDSKLTDDERNSYKALTTKELSATEKRDLALAEAKAMEANRDKPSI